MVEAGEKLRRARVLAGLKQQGLDSRLGVAAGRTFAYEKGRAKIPKDLAEKYADLLKVPVDWLFDGEDTSPPVGQATPGNSAGNEPAPATHRNAARIGQRNIPVLATITAGEPWAQYADAEVEVVPEWGGEFERWGRIVEGDSMEPVLRSGDIAIFENRRVEQNQVVHAFDSGVDTVKCYRVVKGRPELWPFNEEHEPRSAEDWNFKGVCVARIRYGRRKKRSYTDFPGGLTWSDREDDD